MVQHHARPAASCSYRHCIALSLRAPETGTAFRMEAIRVDDGVPGERVEAHDIDAAEAHLASRADALPIVLHGLHLLDDSGLWRDASADRSRDAELHLIDSRALARILLPRLRDHRLRTVAEYFGVTAHDDAKGEGEAGCLARTFLALLDRLFTMDLDVVRNLARLTQETGSRLYDLFIEAEAHLLRHALSKGARPAPREEGLRPSCNFYGSALLADREDREDDEEDTLSLDVDHLARMLDRGGVFSRTMERYEHRPQQIAMTRNVARAFNDGASLIAEAGTGTGKSLSYLVPAIHWALQNDRRVIVSTHTKNLQEQLFFKDIPFLQRSLRLDFSVALLKGRSNYICPDRWHAALAQPDDHLSLREREEALPLVAWARETATGDVSENTGFPVAAHRTLWQKVNAEGGACPRCSFNETCFVNRARAAAARSHLVIVNHALLFSDLAADHAVLSGYAHLIIDEAHNLEKVAVQHLTVEVNLWRIRMMLRKIYVRSGIETGLLATLKWRAERSPMKPAWKDALAGAVRQGIERVTEVNRAAEAFHEAVTGEVLASASRRAGNYTLKHRFQADSGFAAFLNERAAPLLQAFLHLRDTLGRLGATLDEIPASWLADRDEFLNTIASGLDVCKGIEEDLAVIIKADDDNTVYWVEAPQRGGASLIAAPLKVADRLYEELFRPLRSVVLTSATLTAGKRFDYMAGRLGLDRMEPSRLRTFRVDSPFDYRTQTLACVPAAFPSPKEEAFQQAVNDLIQGLVLAARRGTLVLFTAYGMLNRTYAALEPSFERLGVPILAQGISGPRSLILDRFRRTPGSVLLGTDSFWEGIDVPGKALEIVVLVKLPFAVPSEPVVEAQVEQLDRAGRNSFMEYLMPEAIIKFRQGFGRLIRSAEDRGAVVVLDHRVIGTRYGRLFLDSLPTRHRVFRNGDALVEGVTRWFERSGGPVAVNV